MQLSLPSTQAFRLSKKLEHIKSATKNWNKFHFGNTHRKLNSVTNQIGLIQHKPSSVQNLSLELNLKFELEEFLKREELLWKNKSREGWLTCKDWDRFFHTSTIIRRMQNIVDLLKVN